MRFSLLGLAFVALWVFAHDFVAQNINHRIASERLSVEKGTQNQSWDISRTSDLVAVFAGVQEGEKWHGKAVGFSLSMPKWPVNPQIHDLLIIDFDVSGMQPVSWVIEFSDLKTGRFYMATIKLSSGAHELHLNQLVWQDDLKNNLAWQDVPRANTLVVRGFAAQEQQWSFKPWQLKQSHAFNPVSWPDPWQTADCDRDTEHAWQKGAWQLGCYSNNTMVKLDQNISQLSPKVSFQFETFFEVTAWIWLIVFVVLMCWACAGFLHAQLAVLNGLFLVVVVLLIIPELMGVAVWLVLPVVLWLAWRHKSSFISDQKDAMKVWLGVTVLALLLWTLGGWRFDFISQWPVYLLWAVFQQLLLIGLFEHLRKDGQMPTSLAIAVTAVMFALFHVPNHHLMWMTLSGGVFWMWIWSKYQNFLLMVVSHSLWALLLYQAVGEAWLHSARVGMSFL